MKFPAFRSSQNRELHLIHSKPIRNFRRPVTLHLTINQLQYLGHSSYTLLSAAYLHILPCFS